MSPTAGAPAPARLVLPSGHPVFAGHFPHYPIIPGALLLDAALQAIGAAMPDAAVQHLTNIKFFRPVGPGEVLSLSVTRRDDGGVEFEWRCSDERIASGIVVPNSTFHTAPL
jgi:3-hydroxymyristoyl/3-hydroxydecanoyl-(acyl carrier protein) dehydratase